MNALSTLPQPPLNHVVGGILAELVELLAQADPAAVERDERIGGVVSVAIEFYPQLVASMTSELFVTAGLVPAQYEPAALAPAGWDTVLDLVAATYWPIPDETVKEKAFAEGAKWLVGRVRQTFPARGASVGAEPAPLKIARLAHQLALLVEQIDRPGDDLPGGAALLLCQVTAEGLARNMNMGLYNYFGMFPSIENPAYLPAVDWQPQLDAVRAEGLALCPDAATDERQYHFFEGVRWTCAKYRDTFLNLGGVPPAHFRMNVKSASTLTEA